MEEDVLTMGLFCGILKENQMMRNTREGEDMDYLVHNIASNLNHIRKAKGMSLDVVAEQTGVSKSMLAAIEKGAANPSIGVLGKIMSYMHYGIKPDIVSMAKALGSGMPIGAICAREEVAKAFTIGSHGTTFGGHPVCCAAALAEVNELLDRDLAVLRCDGGEGARTHRRQHCRQSAGDHESGCPGPLPKSTLNINTVVCQKRLPERQPLLVQWGVSFRGRGRLRAWSRSSRLRRRGGRARRPRLSCTCAGSSERRHP